MTVQELTQLVSLGEGMHVEFKHQVPGGDRIAREIIAFANTQGGRVLIGVSDDGTTVGVQDAVEEEFALKRALDSYSDPPIEYTLERVPVKPRRDVLVVTIRESAAKPHLLVNGTEAPGVAYVRVNDKSVEASDEAVRLMQSGDRTSNVTFRFGEREQVLMRYLDDYGRITVEQYAGLIDAPHHEASETMVTLARAGILQIHAGAKQDYFTLAYDMNG